MNDKNIGDSLAVDSYFWMQVRNKIAASSATLEQLEVIGCGCGFRRYLICSGGKFGSTDDFHDCSAVAATLDCRCGFFVCNSDLLGNFIPNHRKEKGRTIKKQPLSLKKDCFSLNL